MSETLNVNVLVAAKEEYSKQLINCIQSSIYDILYSIFNDSQKNNGRLSISYSNFQKELKAVPHWTDYKLEEKIQSLNKKFPYLMDLITAIFVSHVKILACVRLKTDDKSVKIKVPSLNSFLHKIVVTCCEQIYYNPNIIHEEKIVIYKLINESVTDTIANQIPIEYILNEYLSGAFDEPVTKYPENNSIIDDVGDVGEEDDGSDEEDFQEESKEIPIIPISKPINHRVVNNIIENNPKPEETTAEEDEENSIERIKEMKNIDPEAEVIVNKKYDISDDEDDDISDDEDDDISDNEDENKSELKENTLF
jgi:hypothetical protein